MAYLMIRSRVLRISPEMARDSSVRGAGELGDLELNMEGAEDVRDVGRVVVGVAHNARARMPRSMAVNIFSQPSP